MSQATFLYPESLWSTDPQGLETSWLLERSLHSDSPENITKLAQKQSFLVMDGKFLLRVFAHWLLVDFMHCKSRGGMITSNLLQ